MLASLILASMLTIQPAERETVAWEAYYACVGDHLADVAAVVVGLEESADLLAMSLCQDEATTLLNTMVQDREGFCGSQDCSQPSVYGRFFDSARSVVYRETRLRVYREKLNQRR